MSQIPVEYLEWDSDFFGRRIGRVTINHLGEAETSEVLAWAERENMDCLYYLASGLDKDAAGAAESAGFHLVDLRVTFIKDLLKPERSFIPELHIRRAVEGDLETLKTMARDAFQLSRFHVDRHFDQQKADEMYAIWIENDLRLKGHDVWVIDVEGQLAAYTSVSVTGQAKAQIGLAGTQPAWRGKGLSLELQRFICHELRDEGIEEIEIVTQGRNIPAQNLYQKAGYYIRSVDLWYHKWFTD